MQVFVINNVSRYFGDDVFTVLIGIGNETVWIGGDTDEQLRQFKHNYEIEREMRRKVLLLDCISMLSRTRLAVGPASMEFLDNVPLWFHCARLC